MWSRDVTLKEIVKTQDLEGLDMGETQNNYNSEKVFVV
jgi:hypothetical protein